MCWRWFPRRLGSMCQVLTCLSSSCLCCLRNTNYFNQVWCMLDVGLQFSTPAARVNIARIRECVFQSHAAKQECAIRQGCLATRDCFFVRMYCNISTAIYCIGLSNNGWSYQCIVLVSPIRIPIHSIDLLRWQNSNTLVIKNVKMCIKKFFYRCSYDVTWLRSTRCSRY